MFLCVWLCVGMCKWVQMSTETRSIRSPRAGTADNYGLPNVGAGNWTQVLGKSSVCFTTEPTLCPRVIFWKGCSGKCHKGYSYERSLPLWFLVQFIYLLMYISVCVSNFLNREIFCLERLRILEHHLNFLFLWSLLPYQILCNQICTRFLAWFHWGLLFFLSFLFFMYVSVIETHKICRQSMLNNASLLQPNVFLKFYKERRGRVFFTIGSIRTLKC